ncbi:MAG: hypothetical protein H7A24_01665 [Leptospiraceae bacterium]|nr:hypothetical protein [Leptospiraceae bacterium]MCP5510561.1 hypothetical protein [Leptospiraceae bacterium]
MRFFITLIISTWFSLLAYPDLDVRGNYNENFLELQGKATIHLAKMAFKEGEDVYLDFTIKNFGKEPIRIFPTFMDLKTYQFTIIDENDESLTARDIYKIQDLKQKRRNTVVNLDGDQVKEIIIHSGEAYVKRFNLSQYFDFTPGKRYFVTGYFYPNYIEDNNTFLKSENHSIFIIEPKRKELRPKRYESSEVVQTGLTPEETIHLFLSAEMKKNWNNYFKFLDLDEFIMAYNKYAKEYAGADNQYKELVMDEFKNHLMEQKAGTLSYYKIEGKEKVSSDLMKVNVYVERELSRYPSKYEYIYTLKKGDPAMSGFWKITNVTVKVRR